MMRLVIWDAHYDVTVMTPPYLCKYNSAFHIFKPANSLKFKIKPELHCNLLALTQYIYHVWIHINSVYVTYIRNCLYIRNDQIMTTYWCRMKYYWFHHAIYVVLSVLSTKKHQGCSVSIAIALEMLQSWTKTSTCQYLYLQVPSGIQPK